LLSKADYPAELNIPLPFSLLNNNTAKDQLEVIPAFWWLYNMYALTRNAWKFRSRDKRKKKVQNIEFDSLAPDTIEEIFNARRLLERWTAKASLRKKPAPSPFPLPYGERIKVRGKGNFLYYQGELINEKDEEEASQLGCEILSGTEDEINGLEVIGEKMEKSKRKVVILKVYKAYHAYGDMLHYYAIKNLLAYIKANPKATFSSMCNALNGRREQEWVNLGGQLIPKKDVVQLRSDIGWGRLTTWKEIHHRYDTLWNKYTLEKQKHALATLCELLGTDNLTKKQWEAALNKAVDIQKFICDEVYISRKKDFDNPFRASTYRNAAEMTAAMGTIEENSFLKQVQKETKEFEKLVEEIREK